MNKILYRNILRYTVGSVILVPTSALLIAAGTIFGTFIFLCEAILYTLGCSNNCELSVAIIKSYMDMLVSVWKPLESVLRPLYKLLKSLLFPLISQY